MKVVDFFRILPLGGIVASTGMLPTKLKVAISDLSNSSSSVSFSGVLVDLMDFSIGCVDGFGGGMGGFVSTFMSPSNFLRISSNFVHLLPFFWVWGGGNS